MSRADGPKEQSFRSWNSSGRKEVTLESKGDYLKETASPDRFITRRKAHFSKTSDLGSQICISNINRNKSREIKHEGTKENRSTRICKEDQQTVLSRRLREAEEKVEKLPEIADKMSYFYGKKSSYICNQFCNNRNQK